VDTPETADPRNRPRGGGGRFRRSLETAHRDQRAARLASQGWHYEDIARELGYANRGAAHKAVQRCLHETAMADGTVGTLGVAFSAPVKKVKWSVDGTGSITDSSTHSVSITYSVPHTIYNRVNYHEYWYNCPNILQLRAYSFWDLLTNDGRQVSITWQWHCGHHPAGADWSTGSAKSATIGGGMSIGPISVSAQAGFGSSVELDFHFNKAGEICGNSPDGPFSSSILEADQY
jgi:hypothetical protein